MKIAYTFRHMDASEALRRYARSRLEKVQRLLAAPCEVDVTFWVDGRTHHVDIHLHAGPLSHRSSGSGPDMYASIDQSADRLRAQLVTAKGGYQAGRKQGGEAKRSRLTRLAELTAETATPAAAPASLPSPGLELTE